MDGEVEGFLSRQVLFQECGLFDIPDKLPDVCEISSSTGNDSLECLEDPDSSFWDREQRVLDDDTCESERVVSISMSPECSSSPKVEQESSLIFSGVVIIEEGTLGEDVKGNSKSLWRLETKVLYW